MNHFAEQNNYIFFTKSRKWITYPVKIITCLNVSNLTIHKLYYNLYFSLGFRSKRVCMRILNSNVACIYI